MPCLVVVLHARVWVSSSVSLALDQSALRLYGVSRQASTQGTPQQTSILHQLEFVVREAAVRLVVVLPGRPLREPSLELGEGRPAADDAVEERLEGIAARRIIAIALHGDARGARPLATLDHRQAHLARAHGAPGKKTKFNK